MDTGGTTSQVDPLPPHLEDIEELCLGAILFDPPSIVDVIGLLQPLDFFIWKHQVIFAAMLKCVEQRLPCELAFVGAELANANVLHEVGGDLELGMMSVLPGAFSGHLKEFGRLIRQTSIRRQDIETHRQGINVAWNDSVAFDAYVEHRAGSIQKLSAGRIAPERRTMHDLVLEGYADLTAPRTRSWPTGIGALDKTLIGLRTGTLNIIAGRPAWGKSALGTQIVWHIAKTYNVPSAIISLEMEDREVRDRMVSLEVNVDMRLFEDENNPLYKDQHLGLVVEAYGIIDPLPIDIMSGVSSEYHACQALMHGLVVDHGVKVIMVDQLTPMHVTGRHQNRTSEISIITAGLKQFAMQQGVVVILLAQMNRDIVRRTNQKPTLADLRDSGSIEQDADTVTFIHRPDLLDSEETGEPEANVAFLHVEKNRRGPVGTGSVRFIPYRMKFVPH